MKRFARLILLTTIMSLPLSALAGEAACPAQPPWRAPAIPDGSTATLEQMLGAQQEVVDYVQRIEHWNNCNAFVPGLQSGRLLRRAQAVAGAYNRELQAFRMETAQDVRQLSGR